MVWTITKGQQAISVELCERQQKRESLSVGSYRCRQNRNVICCFTPNLTRRRIAGFAARVDVCLELFPRIRVFPHEAIVLLHGNSQEPYRYTKPVICTTHQLLKFHAFDLLIVDEVDSFPFVNNEHLYYGA